jgi:FkbM family methyltransferase
MLRSEDILAVGPGFKAKVHFQLCRLAVHASDRTLGGRGAQRVVLVLGRVFGRRDFARFRVFGSREIVVPLADRYWVPPLIRGERYEPEVRLVLERALSDRALFIDCGANVGWWSLFASTMIPVADRVVAVEASTGMFSRLVETADVNGRCFVCVKAAVWQESGAQLNVIASPVHHGRSSVERLGSKPQGLGYVAEHVESITLDDLIEDHIDEAATDIVIKLDIEGAEVLAFQGLKRHINKVRLIVYEDHGKEAEADATRAMLAGGFKVFYLDDALEVHGVEDLDHVKRIKSDRYRGYNFFACQPGSRVEAELAALATNPET